MVVSFFRTTAIFLIPIQYILFSIPFMKTFHFFLFDGEFYLVFRYVWFIGFPRICCVIKEKRRLWKEWKNGSCSKERYIEAKRVARRQV